VRTDRRAPSLKRWRSTRHTWYQLICLAVVLATVWAAILPAQPAQALSNSAFQRTWSRTDKPVYLHKVERTWMWGPALTESMMEPATDAPGGTREVQYFDKSRMEVSTDPDADPHSLWYVTNGLLARELLQGRIQLGSDSFEQRQPAEVNIAGDPADPNAPTYASFANLTGSAPIPNGAPITQRVDRAGNVSVDDALAAYGVYAAQHVQVPGIDHQVASVFWDFMNARGMVYQGGDYVTDSLFQNPFYATGYPLTEPYWTTVGVDGTPREVLVQVFERRVLTYNPANTPEWQVEAGNVGAHYYQWRYGALPTEPGPPTFDFMDDLQDQLAPLVNGWAGLNAVSVTDLQTGRTIGVNGDRPQMSACTIKIFIMMAVAQDIEAGKYTHDDIAGLVQSAMGPSNTWPARELIKRVGNGSVGDGIHRINAIMWDLGMHDSILTHPPDYPHEEYGYKKSHGITENLLTTDDLNLALGKLWRREALSAWATDYVLWSMTLAIPGQQYSLGGGIPEEATLYHKIGLLYAPDNTWNDAGIVTFERNGQHYAYAISYMGSHVPDWHDAYYHGADVSWLAWQAFSAAYP
jgi:beta-lactamase class A